MIYSWLGSVVLLAVRLFVGSVLLVAGILKLRAGTRWFLQQILAYEIVKGSRAKLVAHGLPATEIGCGFLLILGWQTNAVALVSFGLLTVFTGAIISTFWRGKEINCGCLGQQKQGLQPTQWTVVYRNLSLMGLLVVVSSFASIFSIDFWLSSGSFYRNAWLQTSLVVFWLLVLGATLFFQQRIRRQLDRKQLVDTAATVIGS
ncbi:MAG: DoxX family membrane protein [Anaerolineales bacterium]|nr:DoxX family membrane protein [Anaerolineales bacterium]